MMCNSNELGHTLLDTLMITILRNHTYVSPGTVDNALKRDHIFPGQETDICGRWDADCQCYQEILMEATETRIKGVMNLQGLNVLS
jgi:hypothetical protein